MNAYSAVSLRDMKVADISVKFSARIFGVRSFRASGDLIQAVNLNLDLLNCYLVHRGYFDLI
jgi:hypothetical protein